MKILKEKMKNLDYKWFIVIGLGIIIIILGYINISSNPNTSKFDAKIKSLEDSILVTRHTIKALDLEKKQLESQIYVREQKILSQKLLISNLKEKLNEKADSIYSLDNQSTTTYITNWLSKRDHITK